MKDATKPDVWFLMMAEAIAGIQRGDTAPATDYLRFVETHRDRDTALATRDRLNKLARTEAFQNAIHIVNKITNPAQRVAAVTVARPRRR